MKIKTIAIVAGFLLIAGAFSVSAQAKEGVELGKVIDIVIAKMVEHPQLGTCGFATIGSKKVEVYVKDVKKGDKIKIIVKDVLLNPSTKKMEAVFDRSYVIDKGIELGKVIEVTIATEYLNTYTKVKSGVVTLGEGVSLYIPNAKIGEKYRVIIKEVEISAFSGQPEVAEYTIVK